MNINASIIDQRITGIVEDHDDWLPSGTDINKKKSAAFVILCMSTCLEISLDEAAELLTEGGNDAGVDADWLLKLDQALKALESGASN